MQIIETQFFFYSGRTFAPGDIVIIAHSYSIKVYFMKKKLHFIRISVRLFCGYPFSLQPL